MAMELEYIFRIAILLVVVTVVIGMILMFRDQISNAIKEFLKNLGGNQPSTQFPKLIDKGSGTFTSQEIATYIQSCYSTVTAMQPGEIPIGVTNCYILKGNFNADSPNILQGISDSSLRSKVTVTADFSKGVAIVAYQDPEGKILVK
jgi:uncharacterized membrane protein